MKKKKKEKNEDKNERKNEKKNNIMNEKNKVIAFLNKKKLKKKEEKENSNNPNKIISNEENPQEINSKENEKYFINLFEKDIIDVNKMSEDHYNQLRFLNTLYKVDNDLELDSDKDDIGNDNIINNENEIQGLEKESEEKNNDIESIRKKFGNEIGINLVNEVIEIMKKSFDITKNKFDKELICKKIIELKDKDFEKSEVEKVEKKFLKVLEFKFIKINCVK